LIGEPKLLLLDEPSQGLDAPLRAELYDVLRQVRADFKTPVLLVTHDLDECFELGDEMLVMRAGRAVQSGKPVDVLNQPANADVARLLGTFNLIPAEVRALDPGRNTSRLRVGDYELEGPYLPGKFKGDRVTLYLRPENLMATPAAAGEQLHQLPAELVRVIERAQGIRLETKSAGATIFVDLTRAAFDQLKDEKSWVIEVPGRAIRAL
jgi:ABC-type sulfate/molybdate transport systems ATPase subunit